MINKIDNSSPGRAASSVPSASIVRRIASDSAEPRAASASTFAPSRTNAEAGKSLLARASERAQSSPDVDITRVNEVKSAIARGEFSIDPKAVARAFINMENA